MKLIKRLPDILAARVIGLITLLALSLLAWGVATKVDPPTAAIVIGSILLLDLMLDGRASKGPAE